MTTKVGGFIPGRRSGTALWLAVAALAGGGAVAGLLGVGFGGAVAVGSGAAPRELSVSLRPGISLLQAAEQAPRAMAALSRAARGLGEVAPRDGESLRLVSTNLLEEGLLLPGPLGMFEVRLDVQPIVGEPIAVSVLAVEPAAANGAAPGCPEVAVSPALVGAYRAGARLLLLRADGRFVLEGGAQPAQSGSYALGCHVLQLLTDTQPPLRLTPLGTDGWRDPAGATFRPLVDSHHGDVR